MAGGSGGVGSALCAGLARDGWDVALTYRSNRDKAEHTAASVRAVGRRADVIHLDLTLADQVADAVEQYASTPLAAVVYAAGPHVPMDYIVQQPPDRFADTISNDLLACYNLLNPCLRQLRTTSGAILAVTTPAITRYAKKDLLSSAPKAAIQAVIRGIAVEEGRFGVRANCISVGLLEGEGMWNELLARGDYTPAFLANARRNIPLPRFGSVQDVADAGVFLLSAKASWITGQTLAVDGGYSV